MWTLKTGPGRLFSLLQRATILHYACVRHKQAAAETLLAFDLSSKTRSSTVPSKAQSVSTSVRKARSARPTSDHKSAV